MVRELPYEQTIFRIVFDATVVSRNMAAKSCPS
jgi:hypothetical protein